MRHFIVYTFAALACMLAPVATSALAAGDENVSVNVRMLVYARDGDGPGIRRTLSDGADVNSRNRVGETALLIALKKNNLEIAQLMLAVGTDVNIAAVNGVTPLMAAAYTGQAEIAGKILAKGADVKAVDRLGKSAMTYAAGEGRAEVVKLLLAGGVDPNAVYDNDLTALMWAAGGGNADTVKVLLAAGAKTGLKDNRGKTAADIARELKYDDIAKLIESAPNAAAPGKGAS